MINADMRDYEYYTYSINNGYGQPVLDDAVKGTVKMSINNTSQNVQNNIAYKNATYIGLTHNSDINDTYVIKYGKLKLKVLYVQPKGRYKQVFMNTI